MGKRVIQLTVPAALTACTLLVDTSDLDSQRPVADGGFDAGFEAGTDATADAAETDAADAGDACRIQPLPPAPVVPLGDRWTLRSSATSDASGVVLTPEALNQKGAMWWNEPIRLEQFDVTAVLRIEDPDGDDAIADGMAFVWAAGEAIPDIGQDGYSVGALGIPDAYAVILSTLENDSVTRSIAVVETDRPDYELKKSALRIPSPLRADHTLRVRLDAGGVVTVWYDAALAIDRFAIPNHGSFRGHWGFTAATGGVTSRQSVLRVSFDDLTKPCP